LSQSPQPRQPAENPGIDVNPAVDLSIGEYLEAERARVDRELDRILPSEEEPPRSIHRAIRYSVLAGGKRLRPILCLECGRLFSVNDEMLLSAAAALELVHTYSLIHDDLPAMDNDDLRRGKPTSHRVFGEALAILAGDALLTLAFEIISQTGRISPELQLQLIHELAYALGTRGLIGGQVADLAAAGRDIDEPTLKYIHRTKTGALIRAAARTGALIAGVPDDDLARVTRYGEKVGLAFQIADDLLDVLGTEDQLGKTVGKDSDQHKATYPAFYGVAESRSIAVRLVDEACETLAAYDARARRLEEIAHFLITRQS
jgi:geranylgeranyl diphosphate synthase, type II